MRKTLLAALLIFLLCGLSACAEQNAPQGYVATDTAPLEVYTSIYPLGDFAKKIAGDHAHIHSLIPAGSEPHDWEPSPQDLVALSKADIFIYNGAGMEHWVDDVLAAVQNDGLIVVNASQGLTLLTAQEHDHNDVEAFDEDHDHDHDHGHDHSGIDPHLWLDPMNAKAQTALIKDAFCQADPANSHDYEARYTTYADQFDALDQAYRDALTPLAKKDIVVAHEAFGYLCAAYGLHQMGIEGVYADAEPSPARMAKIIAFVQANDVQVIFFEEFINPKVAETIAAQTGAETMHLNPLDALSESAQAAGDDYFSVMHDNLTALTYALSR